MISSVSCILLILFQICSRLLLGKDFHEFNLSERGCTCDEVEPGEQGTHDGHLRLGHLEVVGDVTQEHAEGGYDAVHDEVATKASSHDDPAPAAVGGHHCVRGFRLLRLRVAVSVGVSLALSFTASLRLRRRHAAQKKTLFTLDVASQGSPIAPYQYIFILTNINDLPFKR